MKKVVAFILASLILFSFAYADCRTDFINAWNKAAPVYGAPELSEDNMRGIDGNFSWETQHWEISIFDLPGYIWEVEVYADNPNDFLLLSVMTGLSVVQRKTEESYQQFLSNTLNMYLKFISGKPSGKAVFKDYFFEMDTEGDRMLFYMGYN